MQQLTKTNYDSVLYNGKKKVLMFGAEYCVACGDLKPIIEELSTTIKGFEFYYIDSTKDISIAQDFQVSMLPQLILLNESNEVIDSIQGFRHKEVLEKIILRYI